MTVTPWTDPNKYAVHVAAGRVLRGSSPVPLRDREIQLAVAVAVHGSPISVEQLGALLYGDRDESCAANMVKVYVHRLRGHVGPDFIVHRDGGYSPGCGVAVDVAMVKAFLRHHGDGAPPLPAVEREQILQAARGLRVPAPPALLQCDWYQPVEALSHRLGHDAAMAVARGALESRDFRAAGSICRELTYEDACDEEAWELLIRVQLRLGEVTAARQAFSFLTTALAKELDVAPPPAIRRLIEAGRRADVA